MGLFDFLKKKKKKQEVVETHPEIIVSTTDNGSHGDNMGSLMGFEMMGQEDGNKFIMEALNKASQEKPIGESEHFELKEASISDNPHLKLRLITDKKNVISAFPYLNTTYTLPWSTKEIIEWSHMNNAESEIRGGGRDTFGLDFFPTDYVNNRKKYHAQKNCSMHVSAFALVVDSEGQSEGNSEFSPDFVAYMPSSRLSRQTYYDFIGKVLSFEEVKLVNHSKGYIARVKLINDDEDPDFFTVDMFVHESNMRIPELKSGMKISGLAWMQGEMVEDGVK